MKLESRRKNYLINKSFQFNLVASIIAFQIISGLTLAFIFTWAYLLQNGAILSYGWNLLTILVFMFVLVNIFATVWTIGYTHSISGPILKAYDFLLKAYRGEHHPKELRFREKDLFKRISKPINLCVSKMKKDDARREEIKSKLESLKSNIKNGTSSTEQIEKLQKIIESL